MIRSRYLLLGDGLYRDRHGRLARLAYSARRATLFTLDAATARALETGNTAEIREPERGKLSELKAIVPQTEDELASVLAALRQGSADPRSRGFTIMPTSTCNMACSYCGQEHRKSPAQLQAVQKRVEAAIDDPGTETVHVTWFGGEPLLALRHIRDLSAAFVSAAAEHEKAYTAGMATNGSLLTERNLRLLHEECALTSIEVTVDGPEQVHNRRRLMRNGTATFERIVSALHSAQAFPGLKVGVRINIDADNEDTVGALITDLAHHGLVLPNLELHLMPVHSWGNDVSKVELDALRFALREAAWLRQAASLGWRIAAIPNVLKRTTCVATTVYSEVVDPQGRIYACSEHPLVPGVRSSGIVAHVSDLDGSAPRPRGGFDDWYENGADPCRRCPLLPVCGGACPKLWRDGYQPCPSIKFNFPDRLDIAARQLGLTPVPGSVEPA